MKKSERSYIKNIEEHKEKIANPAVPAEKWSTLDERECQGLILHWQKEIVEFEERLEEVRKRLNGK